jgi:hypothetical protein
LQICSVSSKFCVVADVSRNQFNEFAEAACQTVGL